MTSRASIVVYYDVVSPYSYFGVSLLNRYKAQWKDVDVVFRPTLLVGIHNESKNQPPASVAAKGAYMIADVHQLSALSGVPFSFPSKFPLATIHAMRLLVVVQEQAADKYEQCMNTLYDAYWCKDEDVSKSEVLVKVLAPVLGSEAKVQELLAMSVQKENKQKLIDNTNEAVAAGAFGAPSFVVRKAGADQDDFALFFGGDRLELLAAYLGVPYPGFAAKL